MPEFIEVVIVEDDPRTLKNLVRLVGSFADIRVIGSALSGEMALQTIEAVAPQLVLLDLELPDMNGIDVTKKVKAKQPSVEILILTTFEDELKVYQAIQAGASGYLVKRVAPEKIEEGIREVLNGGIVIEPRIAKRFWNYFRSLQGGSGPESKVSLEPVEREILQMIAHGLTNRETGKALQLERRTVRTHLTHIYQKLGTSSRSEAVVIALRNGLIHV